MMCFHDFSFSLRRKRVDYLSRTNNWIFYVIRLILRCSLITNSVFFESDNQEVLTLIAAGVNMGFYWFMRPLNVSSVRAIDFMCDVLLFLTAFCLLIVRNVNVTIIIAISILLPLSYILSFVGEKRFMGIQNVDIVLESEKEDLLSWLQLPRRIAENLTFEYVQYTKNPRSIYLESISNRHILYCTDYPACFCDFGNETKKEYIDNILEFFKRRQFCQEFVKKSLLRFRDIFLKSHRRLSVNLGFTICAYLLDICESHVLGVSELNSLLRSDALSMSERMYALHLLHKIEAKFQSHSGRINFGIALGFENLATRALQTLQASLTVKHSMYSHLNSDEVNLIILEQKMHSLLTLRTAIKRMILKISAINQTHFSYKMLTQQYFESLSLLESKKHLQDIEKILRFQRQKRKMHVRLTANQLFSTGANATTSVTPGKLEESNPLSWREEDLFENNSCVVMVSVMSNEVGKIIAAERGFSRLFGHSNIIGKSISIIIPQPIIPLHQRLILRYMSQVDGDASKPITAQVSSGKFMPLQLAVDNQGWAVPITVRMQIEYLPMQQEICLASRIHSHPSSNNFVMLDMKSFKVICMTKQFFKQYLAGTYFIESDVFNLCFARIIPAIAHLACEENIEANQFKQKTVFAFLPMKQNVKRLFLKPLTHANANKEIKSLHRNNPSMSLHSVTITIQLLKDDSRSICVLEIEPFRMLSTQSHVREALMQIENTYEDMFNATFDAFHFIAQINSSGYAPTYDDMDGVKESDHLLFASAFDREISLANAINTHHNINNNYSQNLIQNNSLQQQSKFSESMIATATGIAEGASINFGQSSQNLLQLQSNYNNQTLRLIEIQQQSQQQQQSISMSIPQQPSIMHLRPNVSAAIPAAAAIGITDQSIFNMINIISPQASNRPLLTSHSEHNMPVSATHHQTHGELVYTQRNREADQTNRKFEDLNIAHPVETTGKHGTHAHSKQSSPKKRKMSQKSKRQTITKFTNNQQIGEEKKHPASIFSSQSHQNELKRSILMKLHSKSPGKLIKILSGFSIITLLPLAILTLIEFLTVTELLKQENIDFQLIAWPMSLRSIVSTTLNRVIFIKYIDQDIFPGIKTSWADYRTYNLNHINDGLEESDALQMTFFNSDQANRPYFRNMSEFDLRFVMMRDPISNLDGKQNTTVNLQMFVKLFMTNIRQLSSRIYDEYHEEGTVLENFVSFSVQMATLTDSIQANAAENLNQFVDITDTFCLYLLVLAFCIVTIIVPAQVIMSNKIEHILKLFATLSPKHIQTTQNQLKEALTLITQFRADYSPAAQSNSQQQNQSPFKSNRSEFAKKYSGSSSYSQRTASGEEGEAEGEVQAVFAAANNNYARNKQQQSVFQQPNSFKRKNISSTTAIPKTSLSLVFACCFAYTLLIVQPIVNSILSSNFQEQALLNTSFLKTLYEMKAHCLSNMVLNYSYLYTRVNPNHGLYSQAYYKTRVPVFINQNAAKLNKIYAIVQDQIMVNRYQMEAYESFLFKILTSDMCEALRDHPEYIDSTSFTFNYSMCTTSRGTILTKGFEIAVKYFLDQFPILYEILTNNEGSALQSAVQTWQASFGIRDFDEFAEFMISVITTMKDFLLSRNSDYISYMQTIQIALLAFQATVIVLTAYFIWVKLYSVIIRDFHRTKMFLTFVDPSYLVENPYIISFIDSSGSR